MLKDFRTYQMALEFHSACAALPRVPGYLRDQLLRASSSVALNLAEGSGKPTANDQAKFYYIAMGSMRESQAAVAMLGEKSGALPGMADRVGASLHCLIRSTIARG